MLLSIPGYGSIFLSVRYHINLMKTELDNIDKLFRFLASASPSRFLTMTSWSQSSPGDKESNCK